MELRLYDITMPSINPTSLLGTLSAVPPTGGGQVLVGSATTPSLSVPTIEPIYRVVADIGYTPAGTLIPAPAATFVGQLFVSTNTGGAQFQILPATANLAFPRFSYGDVVSPPVAVGGPNGSVIQNVPGGQSLICVEGMALATCGAGGWTAGAKLSSSGTVQGSLVAGGSGAVGTVLAIGISTVAASAQGIVKVGGY